MIKTNNLKVSGITPIIAPADLRQVFPMSDTGREFVSRSREKIKEILQRRDRRLMVVVGPCSIHDTEAAVEYAKRLSALSRKVDDQLLLVMRVYFEKPRTTVGWKGLINDPGMDGSHNISKGLGIARGLLCRAPVLVLDEPTANVDVDRSERLLADLLGAAAGPDRAVLVISHTPVDPALVTRRLALPGTPPER